MDRPITATVPVELSLCHPSHVGPIRLVEFDLECSVSLGEAEIDEVRFQGTRLIPPLRDEIATLAMGLYEAEIHEALNQSGLAWQEGPG